jgi:hypothetical protein
MTPLLGSPLRKFIVAAALVGARFIRMEEPASAYSCYDEMWLCAQAYGCNFIITCGDRVCGYACDCSPWGGSYYGTCAMS